MNIYKSAMLKRPKGTALATVSTILWEDYIDHQTYCDEQDNTVKQHEIDVDVDTLSKLLERDIISEEEYFLLIEEDVDVIIIV